MKTIALLLLVISGCCFAAGKKTSELMAYDFNACIDVVLSDVESIAYIKSGDPSLVKAREHFGKPPHSNLLVGYAGAVSAGLGIADRDNYRIYCIEHLDPRDRARRLQVVCRQDDSQRPVDVFYKPVSEFDGQNTFQCNKNCDTAPFKYLYEMSSEGEGDRVIPQQAKEMKRFMKCKSSR